MTLPRGVMVPVSLPQPWPAASSALPIVPRRAIGYRAALPYGRAML